MQGMFVVVGFFSFMYIISHLFASKKLSLHDEDFPNNELFLEGVGNSFGMFLVSALSCLNQPHTIADLDLWLQLSLISDKN